MENGSNTNTKLLMTLLGIVVTTIAGAGPYFLKTQAAIDKNLAVMVALQEKNDKDLEKLEARITNLENVIPSIVSSQGSK